MTCEQHVPVQHLVAGPYSYMCRKCGKTWDLPPWRALKYGSPRVAPARIRPPGAVPLVRSK